MTRAYTEELVSTASEDGIILEGAVIRPAGGAVRPLAVVFIPGFSSAFYRPHILGMSREMAAHGFTVVSANTRGHDIGAYLYRTSGEPIIGGCWWELFDESPRDVGVWVRFALGLGAGGVALLGHSLGAQKVIYYQAQRQDPAVRGAIAASGPVRRGRGIKPEVVALAEALVAEGRGEELLPLDPWNDRFPPPKPGPVSAQTFLSWGRFNLDVFGVDAPDPAIARIRCPLFVCYGTEEEEMGTAADLVMIRRNARAAARVDTRMFPGADHVYTGHEKTVGAAFAAWLATLV